MRLKHDMIKTLYLRPCSVVKDEEGGTHEEYGEAVEFKGVVWPLGGQVQAMQYGERANYMYNVRIDGKFDYFINEGRKIYTFDNGMTVAERDGICINTGKDGEPDYRIISLKPYHFLTAEVEKI